MDYDALEKRLKEVREDDHERGCEGRFYSCSCDRENQIDQALKDSQVAIADLRERLDGDLLKSQVMLHTKLVTENADLRVRNEALCDIIFRYVDPCDVLPEDDAVVAGAIAANREG